MLFFSHTRMLTNGMKKLSVRSKTCYASQISQKKKKKKKSFLIIIEGMTHHIIDYVANHNQLWDVIDYAFNNN